MELFFSSLSLYEEDRDRSIMFPGNVNLLLEPRLNLEL